MSAALEDVAKKKPEPSAEQQAAEELVRRAREQGLSLTGVDEIVLSLYAKGLTTGEISAHFAEICGASVSKETVSRITDRVIDAMQAWQSRPLDGVYAAVFIDAIVVKVRDGQVANRPVYAAIGVTLAGEKDVLGLWAGADGGGWKKAGCAVGRSILVIMTLREDAA